MDGTVGSKLSWRALGSMLSGVVHPAGEVPACIGEESMAEGVGAPPVMVDASCTTLAREPEIPPRAMAPLAGLVCEA
eukprot:6473566-Pyramimonas_sp.AAC.2